ncbi:helix-turn-helix transcriptional regulator [Streptomyces sp. NPDC001717]|uniref:helix-turn-helix transcriptional regulator n=1 Tax=Streptomyces sp. NPDC001717 TaxID=3364604 RepID=UPI003674018C
MDDFASSTLVAAVRRALADDGIDAASSAPVTDGALLPFDVKRRFLGGVARAYGLLPLLRVGVVLPKIASDPVVAALLGAEGPPELLERWRRLERFTRSRHHVVFREAGERDLLAEHAGPPGAPPEPAENVLVLGVLTVLLTMTGARDLTVTAGRDRRTVVFADGVFRAPPPGCDTSLWRFTWLWPLRRAPSNPAPPAPAHAAAPDLDPVSRARTLLAGDLARRWTLDVVAAELGTSSRSLQRRLQGAGGFQGLLGSIRTEAAAGLLLAGEHAPCLVGFACGYADQPHFTREFKRRTAVTPAAYRAAFARRPGPGRTDHHSTKESHG